MTGALGLRSPFVRNRFVLAESSASFAPPGLVPFPLFPKGLRPGLHSVAASRLRVGTNRSCTPGLLIEKPGNCRWKPVRASEFELNVELHAAWGLGGYGLSEEG
jgi:hypothetical protein